MTRLAFGGFELDPATGELWKEGDCLRIQEQPLKLLLCLLERPGQLVGREELQRRVWAGDIHVGFEDGLNAAAWRLRQALGDSAERPLFIETVPRKGYRFVGKVIPLPGKAPPLSGSFPMPVFRPASGASPRLSSRGEWFRGLRKPWLVAAFGLGLLGAGALLWGALKPKPVPLAITSLVNLTQDPAVDYFASALSRQVAQDLASQRGIRVLPPGATPLTREALPPRTLTLTWTLAREAQGYRVTVSLADDQGRSHGDRVFLTTPEGLYLAHQEIATYLAARAAGS
ncbi:MAG TPA: winged helix-turn-helix domain-containing protein [Geothrix sp.]|jgi:DNA-binding winged helix-turn-helix (wHTH) protein